MKRAAFSGRPFCSCVTEAGLLVAPLQGRTIIVFLVAILAAGRRLAAPEARFVGIVGIVDLVPVFNGGEPGFHVIEL
jgi:hypothetical protein